MDQTEKPKEVQTEPVLTSVTRNSSELRSSKDDVESHLGGTSSRVIQVCYSTDDPYNGPFSHQ